MKKRWNSDSLHHSIRIHHTQARAATKRAEWDVRRSALVHLLRPRKTRHQRQHFCAKSLAICTISRDGVPKLTNLTSSPESGDPARMVPRSGFCGGRSSRAHKGRNNHQLHLRSKDRLADASAGSCDIAIRRELLSGFTKTGHCNCSLTAWTDRRLAAFDCILRT